MKLEQKLGFHAVYRIEGQGIQPFSTEQVSVVEKHKNPPSLVKSAGKKAKKFPSVDQDRSHAYADSTAHGT